MKNLTFGEKQALVEALLACPTMQERERRATLLAELPSRISGNINETGRAREHALGIVNGCLNYQGGIEELLGVLQFFEENSLPMQRLEALIEALLRPVEEQGEPKSRVPFMVEPLKAFVARPSEYEALKSQLLSHVTGEAVAITTALRGAGGFGKTTLARALCHDPAVRGAFPDGILWVTLGESPGDLTGRVVALLHALRPEEEAMVADVESAVTRLAALLEGQRVLLVIDDVWEATPLAPFLRGGEHCARLITTRKSDVLPRGTHRVDVDAMRASEAVVLLGMDLPAGHEAELTRLAARLGEWPLLLRLVNKFLYDLVTDVGLSNGRCAARGERGTDEPGAARLH
ncbi:MAG: hypothetical protein H0T73_01180 [Ardenticatenales bacterium]|nr:hypothetical protein [Ardenticatenales bacterium]